MLGTGEGGGKCCGKAIGEVNEVNVKINSCCCCCCCWYHKNFVNYIIMMSQCTIMLGGSATQTLIVFWWFALNVFIERIYCCLSLLC